MGQDYYNLEPALLEADGWALDTISTRLAEIDGIMHDNQLKMLRAFTDSRVGAQHLVGSTGYGYDDAGRAKLEEVFARLVGAEAALFRHNFMSGTHALTVALFGILRPGDKMLCATGRPYDTLTGVLGLEDGPQYGSLREFGVECNILEMVDDQIDMQGIVNAAADYKVLYIQRSRGYSTRHAITLGEIASMVQAAKEVNPNILVVVDNCYGEFTAVLEPTQVGADLIIGSLIKNPGGGIAPTGGYIAGRADLVELCGHRLTAPGVGGEIGSTPGDMLRQMYLGLYYAPGVTAEALKTSVYASALFERMGYPVTPSWNEERSDIITAVTLGDPDKLIALCGGIQQSSPIDSFVTPEPSPMPGYDCDVIMAAGAFTLGSSIELSCDAPMRAPYTAYLQGGLNFSASRAGVLMAAQRILFTQ